MSSYFEIFGRQLLLYMDNASSAEGTSLTH